MERDIDIRERTRVSDRFRDESDMCYKQHITTYTLVCVYMQSRGNYIW